MQIRIVSCPTLKQLREWTSEKTPFSFEIKVKEAGVVSVVNISAKRYKTKEVAPNFLIQIMEGDIKHPSAKYWRNARKFRVSLCSEGTGYVFIPEEE